MKKDFIKTLGHYDRPYEDMKMLGIDIIKGTLDDLDELAEKIKRDVELDAFYWVRKNLDKVSMSCFDTVLDIGRPCSLTVNFKDGQTGSVTMSVRCNAKGEEELKMSIDGFKENFNINSDTCIASVMLVNAVMTDSTVRENIMGIITDAQAVISLHRMVYGVYWREYDSRDNKGFC